MTAPLTEDEIVRYVKAARAAREHVATVKHVASSEVLTLLDALDALLAEVRRLRALSLDVVPEPAPQDAAPREAEDARKLTAGYAVKGGEVVHALRPEAEHRALCGCAANEAGSYFEPESPYSCKRCVQIASGEAPRAQGREDVLALLSADLAADLRKELASAEAPRAQESRGVAQIAPGDVSRPAEPRAPGMAPEDAGDSGPAPSSSSPAPETLGVCDRHGLALRGQAVVMAGDHEHERNERCLNWRPLPSAEEK